MREIKFRGMHAHALSCNKHLNGTWVYGHLAAKSYINPNDGENPEMFIDEKTVGQYTGLKDKNGTEIYEDDILLFTSRSGEESMCYVVFKDAAFTIRWIENTYFRTDLEYWIVKVKVVGNIYENIELLTK